MLENDGKYGELTKAFYNAIKCQNELHAQTLEKHLVELTENEIAKLEKLFQFYKIYGNNTVEDIVKKYLAFVSDLSKEQLFFFRNDNKYRNSTFIEAEPFYKNKEFMENYTIGLGLSMYLWRIHCEMMRFFKKYLHDYTNGGIYFEIGPGHGEYMVCAMEEKTFKNYIAIDISEISVKATLAYIKHSFKETAKNYSVLHGDFFKYNNDSKFDTIVMGEVLEHVENPFAFLRKIYEMAQDNANIFITTAVNAPQPDHIYQFTTINEITELFKQACLEVIDYTYANQNDLPLEKAEKRKVAIVVGFILRKKK